MIIQFSYYYFVKHQPPVKCIIHQLFREAIELKEILQI